MKTLSLAFLLIASTVLAQTEWPGTCAIVFDASATMHKFKGTVDSEPFKVSVVGEGDDRVLTWQTDVSPLRIDTREKDRDAEVRNTLKAADHAFLRGDARDIRVASLREEGAELPFALTIAGVNNAATAHVANWIESDEGISFDAAFDVSMKQFSLKAKSVMGLIRVHDKVRAHCHFVFTKPSS